MEGIKKKMEDHIREILEKPHITGEDYCLLRDYEAEHPEKQPDLWLPLLLMLITMGGFHKDV